MRTPYRARARSAGAGHSPSRRDRAVETVPRERAGGTAVAALRRMPPSGSSGSLELEVRKGSPSVELTRDEFRDRFRARFADPRFESLAPQISELEDVAWQNYRDSRK